VLKLGLFLQSRKQRRTYVFPIRSTNHLLLLLLLDRDRSRLSLGLGVLRSFDNILFHSGDLEGPHRRDVNDRGDDQSRRRRLSRRTIQSEHEIAKELLVDSR